MGQPPSVPLSLASRSPRRADLLQAAGIAFLRGPFPDVDERWPQGQEPAAGVQQLAARKACAAQALAPDLLILAADTLVFLAGQPLGKPADEAEAAHMLGRLAGATHEVITGVALLQPQFDGTPHREPTTRAVTTRLTFRSLTPAEIAAYVATGEPMGKAGSYAIQGGAADFVAERDGPLDNVVGLPVACVRALLAEVRGA